MAMFLSRIKKALNLGTKSITQNGTYNASSDGYDGYSSVEVNVAGVIPTPITPSNASPAALTSGTAVSPTGNGYAIASYNTKTPSNSSPVVLTSGEIDKIGANGYAIESYSSITPSSSSPVTITSGSIYKASADGKAVKNILSPTPSDSNPPNLNNTSAVYKPTASGYLYSTVQPKVKTGTFTGSTSTTTKVTCGFRPKYICYAYDGSTNVKDMIIYNADMSTTKTIGAYKTSSSSQGVGEYSIGASTSNTVYSIDSDGFTVQKMSSNFGGVPFHYFAIG